MRNFKIGLFFVLFLAFSFTGCDKKAKEKASPLLKEKITAQNFFEIVDKIRKDTLLTLEETDLLSSGIARYSNLIDSLYNKTLAEIINLEKDIRRRQNLSNLTTNAILSFSRFRYDGWKEVEVEKSKFNIFTYTISNISNNDIKKLSGFLQFFTANNQLIRAYRLNIDQPIKAKQFTQFQSTFRLDEQNQNELFLIKALKENPQQIFVSWRPVYFELDNGQKIDLETNN
ncbi:MAG: hypothetical protein N2517_06015 [Ignavibacteria bacterium]|nr:hypothetical protein [Ignavibacteria bacterium]